MKQLLLGIDPGKDKTGAALVWDDGTIEDFEVLLMEHFFPSLRNFLKNRTICCCVLGNGTTSVTMKKRLTEEFPELPLQVVDEAHSTEEARKLYWQLYPPKGLKKLLPRGLMTPRGNMDGLAAVILCRRFLSQMEKEKKSRE
jgi:RNase H-fold protein (predicted Holliday junction resolvase)